MGRKIPARKHKGVKNPEKQQARRFASVKDKINTPPTNPDHQAIPKKFQEIQQLIQRTKENNQVKKPTKLHKINELIDTKKFKEKEVVLPGMRIPEKAVPVFKQLPNEDGKHFLQRIQLKCHEVIREAEFEEKFKVSVKRNEDTGEVESVKKLDRHEVAFLRDFTPKGKEKGKSKAAEKLKILKQRKLDKIKAKQESRMDDFAHFKDEVKFGETVHEPPHFTVLPRKSTKVQEKPGCRDLLLKQVLPAVSQQQQSSDPGLKPPKVKKNKSNQSMADKQRMEVNRLEAVQAYRDIKAKNHREAKLFRKHK